MSEALKKKDTGINARKMTSMSKTKKTTVNKK